MKKQLFCLFLILFSQVFATPKVSVGVEQLFTCDYFPLLHGKKIGLITNQTAVDHHLETTLNLLLQNQKKGHYTVSAIFAPEHGFYGDLHAEERFSKKMSREGIQIYSLHGVTRRPTKEMLNNIDLLVFDIQDLGSRSYTYLSTMCYSMEEAAKAKIPFIVLDRPNPINGIVVDGPMMEDKLRSFVGYLDIPYCHGMTIGELSNYFNQVYKIGCELKVVPMKGWKRTMTFADTNLPWIPTSPNIPEATTPLYYPATGILGEISMVNIGVGYTLPFKVVGAPWIDAQLFVKKLNGQKFPGVQFQPFYYRPFFGRFSKEECQGAILMVTDPLQYKPVTTQYLIIGILQSLYPKKFSEALTESSKRKEMFNKVNGSKEIYRLMTKEKNIVWKLRAVDEEKRAAFLKVRENYLFPFYPK